MSKRFFAYFLTVLVLPTVINTLDTQRRECRPADYGAVGDGWTLDSDAVSRALHECRSGGRVRFEAGKRYLLANVTITGSDVQVEVPAGAELQASKEKDHYGRSQDTWYAVRFEACHRCSLTGEGVLRGCAHAFVAGSSSPREVTNWVDYSCRVRRQCRPRLLGVLYSSHVVVSGLHLRDSAFWTTHVLASEWVSLRGLTISGDLDFPNNDGIDIDGSSHVLIADTRVATADDALCVKTTRGGRPTRHVMVSNCTLQSRSAAVKLGSESRADIYNITFRHLRVLDSNRGLAIQLRDQGAVRDVRFEHISVVTRCQPGRWWGGGEPIYVTVLPRWLGAPVGPLSSVLFRNITATASGGVVVVAGSPESLIRGVTLQDVTVSLLPLQPESVAVDPGPPPQFLPLSGTAPAAGRAAADERPSVPATCARAMAPSAAEQDGPGGWRLCAKLDLRPGPYGVRPFLAIAPVLAQFVDGLEARNVTIEMAVGDIPAGPGCSGRYAGPWCGKPAAELRVASGRGGPSRWWRRLWLSPGGACKPAWYQEMVAHTVRPAGYDDVKLQVLLLALFRNTSSYYGPRWAISDSSTIAGSPWADDTWRGMACWAMSISILVTVSLVLSWCVLIRRGPQDRAAATSVKFA